MGQFFSCHPITGNYYGTPRPVHIGPESPPITYQEHRNLLRNFRTRSKSLSNLEKAVEEGDNSEEDSGLSGNKSHVLCSKPFPITEITHYVARFAILK